MKKIITAFFVTLGIIFSFVLMFVLYLFIFDPLNLKPLFFNNGNVSIEQDTAEGEATGTQSFLSDDQKKTLESFGIDPASLPSSITVEQEACFEAKLGEARFAEISAGASPSITEFMSARGCL